MKYLIIILAFLLISCETTSYKQEIKQMQSLNNGLDSAKVGIEMMFYDMWAHQNKDENGFIEADKARLYFETRIKDILIEDTQ